tara:strand:+ start:4329 stop:5078 length:750 start_codon:yes stop_codon:yes gene_type:complete
MKFFRKTEHNSMDKNKTGKYLKYAFGEITLVVIGILVAILLNEWRVANNNKNQKTIVLNALQLEFEANLQQLDTVIHYTNKIPEAYFIANKMMQKPLQKFTEMEYNKLILGLGWTYTFNPSNGALRSAISSSEIHLINTKRLIAILFSWEDAIKDSEEEGIRLLQFQYDSFVLKGKYISVSDEWKFILPGVLPPHKIADYNGLLQDDAFENYSIRSFAYAKEYLSELIVIREKNIEIIALIVAELKNKS